MHVKQSITVQTPVTRNVTETVKGEKGQETQVTKSITEMREQQQEVELDIPDAPEPTKDQFVDQQMGQYKNLSQERQAQERADLEKIYDQADKSKDGKIDVNELNALVAGLAEHKVDADARQTIENTTIGAPDETSDQSFLRSKQSNEQKLLNAEAALANLPAGDPQRATYEAKVKQLEADFKDKYGDRSAPLQEQTAETGTAETGTAEAKNHTVSAGDTLGRIARENGVTIQDLKAANPEIFQNGKDSSGHRRTAGGDLIYPGDTIKIPSKEPAKPAETPEAKAAKDAIDTATKGVSPDRPTGGSPDRLDEQRQSDQKAVADARTALANIPANDPQRADYEQKVKDLEATVGKKWMTDAAGQVATQAEQQINELTKNPPSATDRAANEATAKKLDDALKQIPEGTPGREDFVKKVEDFKKGFESQSTEADGVKYLQQNFDKVSGGDGKISKEDLQKNMPDGPAKDALLKNFDVLKFGTVESGADAWQTLSKGDVDRLAGATSGGQTVSSYAQELAKENPSAKIALDDVSKQESADNVEKTRQEVEKTLSAKAGHPVKVDWADDMSDADKLRQLDMLKKMASDSSYDNTWKQYDHIQFDVYESRTDSGDKNNLDGYVEEKGKTLKINQPGNGWGGGSDLTDVEYDKQVRAMEKLRDKINAKEGTKDLQAELEKSLSEKAGHPVSIEFEKGTSTEDQLKQLNNLKAMLADPSLDKVWAYYDKVQFNTFEDRRDSGDAKNLTDYVQVDNRTLKINNAGQDGLTETEMDKQKRALEHLRDHGKPYGN
ncbi:MAG TPA: LysM peptidoglycan-binding domain-containing protein [Stenomitos sp.]